MQDYKWLINRTKILNRREFDNLGIYIQPINQGTSYHLEFDIFHEIEIKDAIIKKCEAVRLKLIENGAFFNRPYGTWAKDIYANQNKETVDGRDSCKNCRSGCYHV